MKRIKLIDTDLSTVAYQYCRANNIELLDQVTPQFLGTISLDKARIYRELCEALKDNNYPYPVLPEDVKHNDSFIPFYYKTKEGDDHVVYLSTQVLDEWKQFRKKSINH